MAPCQPTDAPDVGRPRVDLTQCLVRSKIGRSLPQEQGAGCWDNSQRFSETHFLCPLSVIHLAFFTYSLFPFVLLALYSIIFSSFLLCSPVTSSSSLMLSIPLSLSFLLVSISFSSSSFLLTPLRLPSCLSIRNDRTPRVQAYSSGAEMNKTRPHGWGASSHTGDRKGSKLLKPVSLKHRCVEMGQELMPPDSRGLCMGRGAWFVSCKWWGFLVHFQKEKGQDSLPPPSSYASFILLCVSWLDALLPSLLLLHIFSPEPSLTSTITTASYALLCAQVQFGRQQRPWHMQQTPASLCPQIVSSGLTWLLCLGLLSMFSPVPLSVSSCSRLNRGP